MKLNNNYIVSTYEIVQLYLHMKLYNNHIVSTYEIVQ